MAKNKPRRSPRKFCDDCNNALNCQLVGGTPVIALVGDRTVCLDCLAQAYRRTRQTVQTAPTTNLDAEDELDILRDFLAKIEDELRHLTFLGNLDTLRIKELTKRTRNRLKEL